MFIYTNSAANEQLIKKQSIPHDSATKHVSGLADYTDDISEPLNTLHGAIGWSKKLMQR